MLKFLKAILQVLLDPVRIYAETFLTCYTYSGATAASSIANPPVRIGGTISGYMNTLSTGGNGGQLWLYNSSNGSTDALAANYFTDAYYLGMRKGDVIIMAGCTGTTVNLLMGVLGSVTTAGGAIASTGAIISSTFS